eukprot:CAMPEP_0170285676 /NCGR_PEP_ID=MMETSP0116_2-20130129/42891_1 /TAXON_ID=400756 /ORGANISM="Durinskia baltica, Strain CSIRO CS-38" /LENGTH=440 /DNA_ID=CAMNT_0010537085 /DNA_START=76 /DNA_END=1401 /DNA_ORIENTATION=+
MSSLSGRSRRKVKPVEVGETEVEEIGRKQIKFVSDAGSSRTGSKAWTSAAKTMDTVMPDSPMHTQLQDEFGDFERGMIEESSENIAPSKTPMSKSSCSSSCVPMTVQVKIVDDTAFSDCMSGGSCISGLGVRPARTKSTGVSGTSKIFSQMGSGSIDSDLMPVNSCPHATAVSSERPSATSCHGRESAENFRSAERKESQASSVAALDGGSLDHLKRVGTLRSQGSCESVAHAPSDEIPDNGHLAMPRQTSLPPKRSMRRSLTAKGNAFDGYWVLVTRLPDSAHWLTSLSINGRFVTDATGGNHELTWGNGGTILAGGRIIMDGDFLVRIPNEGPMQLFSRGGQCPMLFDDEKTCRYDERREIEALRAAAGEGAAQSRVTLPLLTSASSLLSPGKTWALGCVSGAGSGAECDDVRADAPLPDLVGCGLSRASVLALNRLL